MPFSRRSSQPRSPALQVNFLSAELSGKPWKVEGEDGRWKMNSVTHINMLEERGMPVNFSYHHSTFNVKFSIKKKKMSQKIRKNNPMSRNKNSTSLN